MRTEEMPGGDLRVFLNPFEYRRLVDCAESHMARIAIRLAGESGLKVGEIVNVKMDHIKESDVSDEFFFLHIPLTDEDESLEYARGRPRDAFLPYSLHQDLYEYVESNDVAYDEEIIQVTKRTTQEYFKRAGIEASSRTGKKEYEELTSRDLRIHFAIDAIERKHIHPKVVMDVGGWNVFENLKEVLRDVDESLIVREFREGYFRSQDNYYQRSE